MPDFLKLNFEFEHVNYLFTLTTHDLLESKSTRPLYQVPYTRVSMGM